MMKLKTTHFRFVSEVQIRADTVAAVDTVCRHCGEVQGMADPLQHQVVVVASYLHAACDTDGEDASYLLHLDSDEVLLWAGAGAAVVVPHSPTVDEA
jgi:hypothetical protein